MCHLLWLHAFGTRTIILRYFGASGAAPCFAVTGIFEQKVTNLPRQNFLRIILQPPCATEVELSKPAKSIRCGFCLRHLKGKPLDCRAQRFAGLRNYN